MSIPVANLKNITKDDLNALVQNGVTESNSLEFKRQAYGNTEAEKKELLKDVSAFANSMGGDLILGIDEQDGVATGLVPITGNVEKEVDRLNQILRSGVEPPLLGVSIVSVQMDSGASIVLRIPRSPLAPHKVSAYNSSRFYVRHGRAAVEATMDELRNLFGRQREMNERARDFHERTTERVLSGNPSSRPHGTKSSFLLMQLFPLQYLTDAEPAIELARPEFQQLPLYGLAMSRRVLYTYDGVLNYESDSQSRAKTLSVFYRAGALELCGYDVLRGEPGQMIFPSFHITNIAKAIRDSCSFLSSHQLATDAFVFCSIVNCQNARLVLGKMQWHSSVDEWEPIDRLVLTLPSTYLETLLDEPRVMRQFRPMFDALWNAAGRPQCPLYDADGAWQAPQL